MEQEWRDDTIRGKLEGWLNSLGDTPPAIYLVGGAVRDILLSRPVKDIDLVCQDAESLAWRLASANKAVVVPFKKKPDEPCYRVVDRADSSRYLYLSPMRGESIQVDLGTRDFTMNAMAMQVEVSGGLGNPIDPFGGAEDVKSKLIRAVSQECFDRDPLRILRAVRFAAKLSFSIEGETLRLMREKADGLVRTAQERIRAELVGILEVGQCAPFIRMMDDLNVLGVVFPEIGPAKGCTQNSYHHQDVWQHSLAVLENCEYVLTHLEEFFGAAALNVQENLSGASRVPLLKLAGRLHDVGKPGTRALNQETGKITFYGHDREGASIVEGIANRLCMSTKETEFLKTLVAEHLHVLNLSQPEVKSTTRLRWFRKLGDESIPILVLGIADIKGTLGPDSNEAERQIHVDWSTKTATEYYDEIKSKLSAPDLIGGKDLLALGMKPGPEIGRVLREVREAQDQGTIHDREGAIVLAKRILSKP